MKEGNKFTCEIYPGNFAEITIMSVDERGYSYSIAFPDGRKGSGYKRWSDLDALPREAIPTEQQDRH